VAEERVKAPAALTRASKPGCGKPKWKLTTAGRASSTTTHMALSKGARAPGAMTFLPSKTQGPDLAIAVNLANSPPF
jgi:hypothetical protein